MAFSAFLYFLLVTAAVLAVLPVTEGKGGRGGGGLGRRSGSNWFSFRRSRFNPPPPVYSSFGHRNYHSSEDVVSYKKPEDQFIFSTDYMLKDLEDMRDSYLKLHIALRKTDGEEDKSDNTELDPSVLQINKRMNDMLDRGLGFIRELEERSKY